MAVPAVSDPCAGDGGEDEDRQSKRPMLLKPKTAGGTEGRTGCWGWEGWGALRTQHTD